MEDNNKMHSMPDAPDLEATLGENEEGDESQKTEDRNQKIEILEAELAELKDQQLRTLAEMENVRRRAVRDREEAGKYAITQFAREILGVADNISRALESVAALDGQQAEALKIFIEGVQMTERELLRIMEKSSITKLMPLGEKFHPDFHQAMFELENTGQAAGTIIQVLQPGYTLNDRLLRPAMVGVAKGEVAPKASE